MKFGHFFALLGLNLLLLTPAMAGLPFPDIKEIAIDLPGNLYVPDDGLPHPGIVVLHGSEGGAAPYSKMDAQILAHYGHFSVLALCYFGCDDPRVPKNLFDVDLSKTYDAWNWLKNSKHVQGKKTAIFGISRGAEQALNLVVYLSQAKISPMPDAIAVHAPFNEIVTGYSPRYEEAACWTGNAPYSGDWKPSCGLGPDHPAWTWKGSLKFLTPWTPIEIEKYVGPLYVSHGTEDPVWNVQASVELMKRYAASGGSVSQVAWKFPTAPCASSTSTSIPNDRFPFPTTHGAIAEFNFMECEQHVLSQEAGTLDIQLIIDFLNRRLGQ